MDTEITPRQQEFLEGLCRLVVQQQAAVHYSEVARYLGVNRYSAYDMLKVLEGKELVAADYVLASTKDGPGRSRVVFFPTRQGLDLLAATGVESARAADGVLPIASPTSIPEEWASFKEAILGKLAEARMAGKRELMLDLLSRLPERRRPLHYCAQMVTALVLNLERLHEQMLGVSPFEALEALATNEEESVNALAGLSLGSALVAGEADDQGLASQLLGQMDSFQQQLHGLSSDSKRHLSAFLGEAIRIFDTGAAKSASIFGRSDQG